MRTLAKNKTTMLYANYLTESPDYLLDEYGNRIVEYVTEDGDIIYSESGELIPTYTNTSEMEANIAESGGESEAQSYGLSIADYSAVVVYKKGVYSLEEGSLVWVNSPVLYQYNTDVPVDVDGIIYNTKMPVKVSADFIVIKVQNSLNFTKAILKAIEK